MALPPRTMQDFINAAVASAVAYIQHPTEHNARVFVHADTNLIVAEMTQDANVYIKANVNRLVALELLRQEHKRG